MAGVDPSKAKDWQIGNHGKWHSVSRDKGYQGKTIHLVIQSSGSGIGHGFCCEKCKQKLVGTCYVSFQYDTGLFRTRPTVRYHIRCSPVKLNFR